MILEHIILVQQTFKNVQPVAPLAADMFYQRLFELDASLRPLFKGDMQQQGAMLMGALSLAVRGLSRPEMIIPTLQALGRRHVRYGVRAHHYDTVGAALLWTLEQVLGEQFTPEVRVAWSTAYTVLATVMQEAAMDEAA